MKQILHLYLVTQHKMTDDFEQKYCFNWVSQLCLFPNICSGRSLCCSGSSKILEQGLCSKCLQNMPVKETERIFTYTRPISIRIQVV